MRSRVVISVAFMAGVLIATVTTPGLVGAEWVISPGTACVPVDGHTNFKYHLETRLDYTGTGGPGGFTCPVVHGDASTAVASHTGEARVVDISPTEDFACRLYSITRSGTSYSAANTAYSSGASLNIQTIGLWWISIQRDSYQSLYCSMPTNTEWQPSRIYGYIVYW